MEDYRRLIEFRAPRSRGCVSNGPVIVLSAIDATLGLAILLFKQGIGQLEALMFIGPGIEQHQRAGTETFDLTRTVHARVQRHVAGLLY